MRIRATIVVDEDIWVEMKKKAIDERKTFSEALEELMKMKLNGMIKGVKKK
jgi:predicted CopG family antitoxin